MCAAHVHGPRGPCACTTHAVPRSNWWRHVGEARSKGGHANSRRALGYLHLAIDYGAGGRRASSTSTQWCAAFAVAPVRELRARCSTTQLVRPRGEMLAWSLCSGKRQPRAAIGRCTAGCGAVSLYAGGATAMAKHATTKTAAGSIIMQDRELVNEVRGGLTISSSSISYTNSSNFFSLLLYQYYVKALQGTLYIIPN